MLIDLGFCIVCGTLIFFCVRFKSERDVARTQRDTALDAHKAMIQKFSKRLSKLEEPNKVPDYEDAHG